jgi:hypothetical protein
LHDHQFLALPERQQRLEFRMQAGALVQSQYVASGNGKRRTQLRVQRIGIGHHRVQPVVAAFQFHQDQDPVGCAARAPADGLGPARGVRRQQRSARESGAQTKKVPALHACHFSW